MVSTTKVSLSLPTEVLRAAEERLARPDETRSALVSRVLQEKIRELEDREAEDRYLRGYREQPETDDELAANRILTRAALARR